jgi:predicted secreted protein
MATLGNNIIVQIQSGQNWVAVGAARTDEIQVDGEQIEIASKTSGKWREFLTGRNTWSVQTSYLVTAASDIRELLKVNTTVRLRIGGSTMATGDYLTGYAIIKTQKLTAPIGGLANGTIVFLGNGALE